jgi:hypothetical protein
MAAVSAERGSCPAKRGGCLGEQLSALKFSPIGDRRLMRGPSSGREESQNTAASRFCSTVPVESRRPTA